ncbi:DUF4232 domain-containing protein [Streptomyces sp. NPDC058045]|uniref:DUF4232 domain-containing protein n=1 Tax=Streptomyces sp. NPDC058045 TaxID=3346311 RepID=UPI0036ECE6C8
MSGSRRKALLVSVALVGGTMLMTACQDSDAQGSSSTTPDSKPTNSSSSSGSSNSDSGNDSDAAGKETEAAAGSAPSASASSGSGKGGRQSVGQSCGANDISWSTKSESQAGGYILITAKAKPGITCYLPAGLPTVAFGSDGTQAGPAEQSAGPQIKLSQGVSVYAGVNPKTTKENGGKELDSIIVAVGDDDPNPVSLRVGTITVDKPIVTNWHTDPSDAVPFN